MNEKHPINISSYRSARFDSQDVIQVLIDFNIARRNLQIYPLSHEQVKRSVVRACKGMNTLLNSEKSVTLAVMKDGIGIGDQVYGTHHSALVDLAGTLKQCGIATITFKSGLAVKEFAWFLKLICADQDKIEARGGIVAVAKGRRLTSIEIQVIDYSKLQLTEESNIRRRGEEAPPMDSIWQQFVSNIMSNPSVPNNIDDIDIDPDYLAKMLNQKSVNIEQVVDHYQKSFSGAVSSGGDGKRSAEGLLAFRQMINGLNTELKEQFLSVTFDKCNIIEALPDAVELVDGLGGEIIVQMLGQAGLEGKKISPSLLSFIKKMGHLKVPEKIVGELALDDELAQGLSEDNVKSLLGYAEYDSYVDGDYAKLFNRLSNSTQTIGHDGATHTLAQEIQSDLKNSKIHIHTSRAVKRLMTGSMDTVAYRDWARQLTFLLDDLLRSRAYGYLKQVIVFLWGESNSDVEERAKIAGLAFDYLSTPRFVSQAVESVQGIKKEDHQDALDFLTELGEQIIVDIFDRMDPQQKLQEKDILFQVLHNLAPLSIQEAIERLNDKNSDYVRLMVRIIREMGDVKSAEQVQPLTSHHDLDVRMEALATLITFENKWSVVRLRELLNDTSSEAFHKAAELAGRYKVHAVVPQLEEIVLRRVDLEVRESALRALGEIGEPRSIAVLNKIARRWSISKKQNQRVKRIVFKTLEGYPKEAVKELLSYGMKQKDVVIKSICERLLSKL